MPAPSFANLDTSYFQRSVIEACFPFVIKTNKRYRELLEFNFAGWSWQETFAGGTRELAGLRLSCDSARGSICAGGRLLPGHKVGSSASRNCALAASQRKDLFEQAPGFCAASAWPRNQAWLLPSSSWLAYSKASSTTASSTQGCTDLRTATASCATPAR